MFNIFPYKKDEKTGKTLKKMLAKLFFCGILGALPRKRVAPEGIRRGAKPRFVFSESESSVCAGAGFPPKKRHHQRQNYRDNNLTKEKRIF